MIEKHRLMVFENRMLGGRYLGLRETSNKEVVETAYQRTSRFVLLTKFR